MRKFLRFRLRSFFVLMFVIAVVMSCVDYNLRVYKRETDLLKQIESINGPIGVSDSKHEVSFCAFGIRGTATRYPNWLMSNFPSFMHPEIFERVNAITFISQVVNDETLILIGEFPNLRLLWLKHGPVSAIAINKLQVRLPGLVISYGLEDEDGK